MRLGLKLSVIVLSAHTAIGRPAEDATPPSPVASSPIDGQGTQHRRDTNSKSIATTSFTLPQVQNPHFQSPTGLDSLLRTYAKFNGTLTPELQRAAVHINSRTRKPGRRSTISGTIVANPPFGYDYEYVVPVSIGTPPQTVYLDLDTGSGDFWTFSSDTPPWQVKGQRIYKPDSSKTSQKLKNYTWSIGYGDGSGASGIVYTDRVALGSAVYSNQSVESASAVSPEFSSDYSSSGILGLGMSSGNTIKPARQLTFMDNIKSSLAKPLFTANLKHTIPGNYNFGYINAAEYTGTIQYAPVDTKSIYWKMTPTGYAIGKAAFTTYPFAAIVDTGTTLLLLPDAIVKQYYAQIKGSGFDNFWGGIVFPCQNTPPDFTFGYGNYRGLVPGRYINYGNVNRTTCYGGIQSSKGLSFSIFGDILLKAQFVVFDLGNNRVGFANKKLLS